MKSFDDKWITTLKNPQEDTNKKFKAILHIKKCCKDNKEDMPRYISILNEYHRDIFYFITEKLAKYRNSNSPLPI